MSCMELKPCPFCGGEASMRDDTYHSSGVYVGCSTTGCLGADQWDETESQAIKTWNTRATPDIYTAVCAERDALLSEVDYLQDQVKSWQRSVDILLREKQKQFARADKAEVAMWRALERLDASLFTNAEHRQAKDILLDALLKEKIERRNHVTNSEPEDKT